MLRVLIEGGDSTGKSHLAKALTEELIRRGHTVSLWREPGGTPQAEGIRQWLKDHHQGSSALSIALAFQCARVNSWEAQCAWAKDHPEGIIVCDRSWPSTVAYQGPEIGEELEGIIKIGKELIAGQKQLMILLETRLITEGREDELDLTPDNHEEITARYLKQAEPWLRLDHQGAERDPDAHTAKERQDQQEKRLRQLTEATEAALKLKPKTD